MSVVDQVVPSREKTRDSSVTVQELRAELDRLKGLVRRVLDYRDGKGEYDFSHLPEGMHRAEASGDAWGEIEAELRKAVDDD